MKNKSNAITLNGVYFSESMMERLQRWYNHEMEEDYTPHAIICNLEEVQRFIVSQSESNPGKDEDSMKMLRKLLFAIDEIKPFTEGGRA